MSLLVQSRPLLLFSCIASVTAFASMRRKRIDIAVILVRVFLRITWTYSNLIELTARNGVGCKGNLKQLTQCEANKTAL